MWGRGSRVFDDYSENSFNNLYGFLCHASESGDYTEWERSVAKRAKEKVDSYSAIAESLEDPGKLYVRIGWFGDELRDLLSLFVWNFKLPGGGGNHFAELVEKLKARDVDPLYAKESKEVRPS